MRNGEKTGTAPLLHSLALTKVIALPRHLVSILGQLELRIQHYTGVVNEDVQTFLG